MENSNILPLNATFLNIILILKIRYVIVSIMKRHQRDREVFFFAPATYLPIMSSSAVLCVEYKMWSVTIIDDSDYDNNLGNIVY